MKTFKTFMAVMAMVLVSGAAKAQSTVSADDFGNDTEWMTRSVDNQEDPIVGTFFHNAGAIYHYEYWHINADGTILIQYRQDNSRLQKTARGTWFANGDTYTLQTPLGNYQVKLTTWGLAGEGWMLWSRK